MEEIVTKQKKEIKQLLFVQLVSLLLVSAITGWMVGSAGSVLFGGLIVMLSTWHVHSSVYKAEGDRAALLKMAGLRFAFVMLLLGAAVFVLKLQPIYLVAGMATSYVAMYIKSLAMIFKQMKGDSRE